MWHCYYGIERVKRVQHREEIRFGSRVMQGGDMYEQQKEFREIIEELSVWMLDIKIQVEISLCVRQH